MNLTDENKLLLYCTQLKPPEAELDQVRKLIKLPLKWDKVLKTALRHGMAPLLYFNLIGIQENQFISQGIMQQLKRAYDRSIAKNTLFYSELHRVLEKFQESGVDAIVLKGAALAETVYGNIALRTFGDIDLLVRKDNLPCVEQLMYCLNYNCIYVEKKSQQRYREKHFHLAPYVNSDKLTAIDVHWHITSNSSRINIDEWWKRAKRTKIAGREVLILSPEHMLIHLCLHLFNHRFDKSRLRVLCDIFETLKYYKNQFDWAKFREEVSDYGIKKLVYSIFYLVKKIHWSDSNLPNWLNPTEVPIDLKLVALIESQILTLDENSSSVPGPLAQLLVADKFQDKFRFLLNIVFPPREVISNLYSVSQSSKKLYFYYLVRPIRLFLTYRKSILETFTGEKKYINK